MTASIEPERPADTDIHCPECDYNLTGTTGGRCPWCGWFIDERVLSTIEQERSSARRIGAILACLACGLGAPIAVAALVRHSAHLSIRDGMAAVGVLIAAVGHIGLAGMLIGRGSRRRFLRSHEGTVLRFAGWFSIVLGVVGATELLRSRDVLGVPVTATFEFMLAAVFYTLPGVALLVMRMVLCRDVTEEVTARATRRAEDIRSDSEAPFLVDIVGCFDRAHVVSSWQGDPRPTSPAVESAIEQAWSTARALAECEGSLLFDGRLVCLRAAAIHDGALQMALGPTSYRAFVGTNMNRAITGNRAVHGSLANPLGISAAILTGDGFIVLGRRGSRVAFHAGYAHPFGGMVEESDRLPDGGVDLFGAMLRELEEELGVTHDEVAGFALIGLVRDRQLLQPELIFDVSIRPSRRALEARFDPERSHGEHIAIEFLYDDPEAAIPSLDRLGLVTPVAEAAYLLHGQRCWGAEWFDQICLLRYGALPQPSGRFP